LRPWTYVHRYPGPNGSSFIRYSTNGSEINGSKPIEAIPLYGPDARDRLLQLSRDVDLLREALTDARAAIDSLDEDELGRHPELGHPYRDELLANIDAALSSGISEQGEM
jgi:hypothetical protein